MGSKIKDSSLVKYSTMLPSPATSVQALTSLDSKLPEGKTSIFWAIFLVVNAALGAGLLTFPLSFYMTGGIVVGILVELALIFFVVGGVLVLVYCADITQSPTYEATVEAICGPWIKVLAEACLVAFCFFSNTAYLVVIGDQLEDLMDPFKYHDQKLSHYWWGERKILITAISLVFILPMLFFRRIGILGYTSFLSVLCCFYIATIVTVRYFHPYHGSSCEGQSGVPKTCSRGVSDIIIAIPFICFGYQCHVSSIPVYADMKGRSFRSFLAVIIPGVFICFCVYTFTGVFGLLRFDPSTCIAADILQNYCSTDIPVSVARGLLALVIVTSYPILTFCGRSALDSVVMRCWRILRQMWQNRRRVWCRRIFSRHHLVMDDNVNSVQHFTSKPLKTASKEGDDTVRVYRACRVSAEGIRLRIESLVWFCVSLILALYVPVISYIISFTGGLAASFIFLFPGLLLLRLMLGPELPGGIGRDYSKCQRVFSVMFGCLITTLGTFIFGLSVVYTIMHDANLF